MPVDNYGSGLPPIGSDPDPAPGPESQKHGGQGDRETKAQREAASRPRPSPGVILLRGLREQAQYRFIGVEAQGIRHCPDEPPGKAIGDVVESTRFQAFEGAAGKLGQDRQIVQGDPAQKSLAREIAADRP